MLACALKYFAVFSVLALWIFDFTQHRSIKSRFRITLLASFTVLPTLAYMASFLAMGIPNPIQDYQAMNGYGHLAGPFLLKPIFYLRWLLWVFVKNPSLPLSALALFGFWRASMGRRHDLRPIDRLFLIQWACLILFSVVFASSFYVHDYYALPFLIPIIFYAAEGFAQLGPKLKTLAAVVIAAFAISQVAGSLKRIEHFETASKALIEFSESQTLGPRSLTQNLVLWSDLPLPLLPTLSKRTMWMFDPNKTETHSYLEQRVTDPRFRGLVLYTRENDVESTLQRLRSAAPTAATLTQKAAALDLPIEGGTRLMIWAP
jgi:hypothetical protein